jgi:hypothetical protein
MCVLALWLGSHRSAGALVVAANRDEAYARPSAPPSEIEPGIFAGRDLEAGGTWLGFTRDGLFVAVTNRRSPRRTPESASRGLLTLDALRCGSLAEIRALVAARVAAAPYGGFNLVAVRGGEGVCFHFDGALRPLDFGVGTHVISSDFDLNDPRMPEKEVFDRFLAAHPTPSVREIEGLLGSHDGARPICKHGEQFGTVSSAILRLAPRAPAPREHRWAAALRFADGAPCDVPYRDIPTI